MKNITLSNRLLSDTQISGTIILKHPNQVIGTYEFYSKESGFFGAINIYSSFQNKGIGFYAFSYCYNFLKKKNPLTHFIALWHKCDEYSHLPNEQSINMKVYLDLINKSKPEDVSLWSTPTGKWLKKLGFMNAVIINRTSDSIRVLFSK